MIANMPSLLRSLCLDFVDAFASRPKVVLPLYPILCRREVLGAASYFVLADMLADSDPEPRAPAHREPAFVVTLKEELESRRYRPGPVSWIIQDRMHRPCRLLSVKDRIVHTALLLVLEAALAEACSEENPEHARTLAALRRTVRNGSYDFGAFDIEDGDGQMRASFPTLLRLVVAHVHDDDVLRLLRLFLKAPVVDVRECDWRTGDE
ncbi:hypothetical protein OH491_04310 [Termitidicoccus mucosus]|uniref:Uncharacterized protein n=1 Tax=Termitidicoccus mucosus TaxID=1184151 RepID=A0A178IMD2_9BACT|nr:hypothetical protein AW736_05290 [Opitutaceae bacterium TSB47]